MPATSRRAITLPTVLTLTALLTGCSPPAATEPMPAPAPLAVDLQSTPAPTPDFTADVRAVANNFIQWIRLTRTPSHALARCSMWPPQWTAKAHISHSPDARTHGKKLYHLYALDPRSYGEQTGTLIEHGLARGRPDNFTSSPELQQAVVKDAFEPLALDPVKPDEPPPAAPYPGSPKSPTTQVKVTPPPPATTDQTPIAYEDRERFVAGRSQGRFIMLKYPAATPGTDNGWIYATVEQSGNITQIGQIESCMECHTLAPRNRLFGLDAPIVGNERR